MLGAVSVSTFMLLLDITVVNVALPHIQRTLHSSFADLQWVIDAYALGLAAFLVSAGSLGDALGRRRLFTGGVGLFTLASLLCGLAPTQLALDLMRALQGVGGAVIYAVAPAMIAHDFEGRQRGIAFGISGGITGLAVAVGPLLGGALTAVSWRSVFLLNVPIGFAVIAVALTRVRESRDPNRRGLDRAGLVSFSAALCLLVFALIRGGYDGWATHRTVLMIVGGLALLGVFIAVERRHREPMFDLGLFRKRSFNGLSISTLGLNAALNVSILFQVLYLENVLGFSPLKTGLCYLPLTIAVFVVAAAAGAMSGSVSPRLLLGGGALLLGVGLLVTAQVRVGDSWTVLLPGMIVSGVGVGLFNPTRAATAVDLVPRRRAGMSSGISETFQQGGVALGVAAIGSLAHVEMRRSFTARAPGAQASHSVQQLISGDVSQAVRSAPPSARHTIASAAQHAVVSGLVEVLVVGGVVSLLAGVAGLVLVRGADVAGEH